MSLLLRGPILLDSVGIYEVLPFSAFGIFLPSPPHEKQEGKHFYDENISVTSAF